METFTINAQKRTPAAKSEIRKMKGQGFVPGILYDAHQNVPLSIQESDIKYILEKHGENAFLSVNYNGSAVTAKIQEIQRDPVSKDITHIDLMPVQSSYTH